LASIYTKYDKILNLNLRNNYYISIIYMSEPKILEPPTKLQQTGLNGTSVRDSAFQTQQQRSALLASLGSTKGGNRRRMKRGGQNLIAVPQPPKLMNDPAQGTSGGVSEQIKGSVQTSALQKSQASLDNKVALVAAPKGSTGGAKRTKRRGGFVWPCLSGGKTRNSKKSKKSRKSRKSKK
jgi:hypothetical protein